MQNGFWHYKVTWCFDDEERHNQGFVCANSFAEVAEMIDGAYDEITEMTIIGLDAYKVLDFEDILDYMGLNSESSGLGPQIIAALNEAIAIEKEQL